MEKSFWVISVFHKRKSLQIWKHQGDFWVNCSFKKSFNKQEAANAEGVKQLDEMMCSLIQLHYFYQTLIQSSGWVGERKVLTADLELRSDFCVKNGFNEPL